MSGLNLVALIIIIAFGIIFFKGFKESLFATVIAVSAILGIC